MKKAVLLSMVIYCSALLAVAQVPAYEYVLFQKGVRKPPVQLPQFTVSLKKAHWPEKAVYKDPPALFVVSDIEGQYDAFTALLQKGSVIDQHANWTFGKGHLVVVGDVFDRGGAVTECLWLIYRLEEQAKKAGGYVHYILGNHELMNLSGDYRYVHPRYNELARQAGVGYNRFYSMDTELGRWLRTKNIIEKIGDHLFVHGGLAPVITRYVDGYPLDSLNELMRPYYDQLIDSMPKEVAPLFSDVGPMWYRGYYAAPVVSSTQVDSVLMAFAVKKIVTGHTLMDRITPFFGGRVINVDVPHAEGASEGLLIQHKKYYRVTAKGIMEDLDLK